MLDLKDYHENRTFWFHQNFHEIQLRKYLNSLNLRSEKREKRACKFYRAINFISIYLVPFISKIKKVISKPIKRRKIRKLTYIGNLKRSFQDKNFFFSS